MQKNLQRTGFVKIGCVGILAAAILFCMVTTSPAGSKGNGTVIIGDLVWLEDANCFGEHEWADQKQRINNLRTGSCGLKGSSTSGNWRLPTIYEFDMIRSALSRFHSVKRSYWSSTEASGDASLAYMGHSNDAYGAAYPKTRKFYAWPVRSKFRTGN